MNDITGKELENVRPKGSYSGASTYKTIDEFMSAGKGLVPGERFQRSQENKRRFLELLMMPDFHLMSLREKADAVGVDEITIGRWMIQVPDSYLADALKETRGKFARHSLAVDAALVRESTAEGGDAKHKELYYRRAEGWEPKQNLELSRGLDKELTPEQTLQALKDALQLLPEDKRAELLREAQQPPVLEAKSDPEKPSEIEMNVNGVVEGGQHES